MATKKQKREAALAKREAEMAKIKAEGLAALQHDREYREAQRERIMEEAMIINQRHQEILNNETIKRADAFAKARYIGEQNPGTSVRVEN